MIKRIIAISLISTITYGEYRSTTFKRAEEKNIKPKYEKIEKKKSYNYNTEKEYKKEETQQKDKNDYIYFRGRITIVDKWYDYTEIYIENENREEIRARISKYSEWKVNDKVVAGCRNLISGFYRKCRIKRLY